MRISVWAPLFVLFLLTLSISASAESEPEMETFFLISPADLRPHDLSEIELEKALLVAADDLRPEVLHTALQATSGAIRKGIQANSNILTVIDFSLPSTKKRLWTFDISRRQLLFHEHVSHGRNSGENVTQSFSNEEGSFMSSLGLYKTDEPYIGRNGYSLRLVGLEKGFNDNAYSRAVVVHGAWYVSEEMIELYGRLGRSGGCPAVRQEIATPLIETIKNGSLLFAYFPEQQWLQRSTYLRD